LAGARAFIEGDAFAEADALADDNGLAADLAIEDLLARIMAYIATGVFYEQDEPAPYPITIQENPGQA
jgi:hypothetical protein